VAGGLVATCVPPSQADFKEILEPSRRSDLRLDVGECHAQQLIRPGIAFTLLPTLQVRDVRPATVTLPRASQARTVSFVIDLDELGGIFSAPSSLSCKLGQFEAYSTTMVSTTSIRCDFDMGMMYPRDTTISISLNGIDFVQSAVIVRIRPPSALKFVSGTGVTEPLVASSQGSLRFGVDSDVNEDGSTF